MNSKIVIAHAVKSEGEIKKIKTLVQERFAKSEVEVFNYLDFSESEATNIVEHADALIISGYGRLIPGSGVNAVFAARKEKMPVYFVMTLNHDRLNEHKACLWAYRRTDKTYIEKPIITELTSEDEVFTDFYGKQAIILPTYAM